MDKFKVRYWNQLTDQELINLLLCNDEEAVEYLFFHRCDGMFARIVKTVFSFQTNKEDLITDFYLFLSANEWSKLRTFQYKSSLNTWLTVISVRFFYKMKSSSNKLVSMHMPIDENRSAMNGNAIIDSFDSQFGNITKFELYDAINKLENNRYRWVLLSSLSGATVEEMSVSLNCTQVAIYNLIKRAKVQLSALLKDKKYVR